MHSRYREWFMTKINVFRLVMLVRCQFKRCMSILNTTLGPSGHDSKAPSSKLGTLYSHYRQWCMTKMHVWRIVLFVRRQFKRCMSISNIPLGPSGRDLKPSSSKSMYVAWFCLSDVNSSIWGLISNTILGPSGHGKKPPSSRMGTLYSRYRQWFMTKIHVFRLVMLVRRQFKRCMWISNTSLGRSGCDLKPPSSRLGTLCSHYRQWFMKKNICV